MIKNVFLLVLFLSSRLFPRLLFLFAFCVACNISIIQIVDVCVFLVSCFRLAWSLIFTASYPSVSLYIPHSVWNITPLIRSLKLLHLNTFNEFISCAIFALGCRTILFKVFDVLFLLVRLIYI